MSEKAKDVDTGRLSTQEKLAQLAPGFGERVNRAVDVFDSVEAAVDSAMVRVRALVELDDLRDLDALGPLAGILDKRTRIELTGTMDVLRPGLGEFRVASVKIADLSLPRSAIPRLLARLDKTVRPEGVAPDGIAITIPEYIGDVRISRGEITLYRRRQ